MYSYQDNGYIQVDGVFSVAYKVVKPDNLWAARSASGSMTYEDFEELPRSDDGQYFLSCETPLQSWGFILTDFNGRRKRIRHTLGKCFGLWQWSKNKSTLMSEQRFNLDIIRNGMDKVSKGYFVQEVEGRWLEWWGGRIVLHEHWVLVAAESAEHWKADEREVFQHENEVLKKLSYFKENHAK